MRDGFNFTPIHEGVRCRMRADLTYALKDKRGPGPQGIVTDTDTGKRYRIEGRPCELPACYCDAEIIEI